jgi:predicted Holliday junction resolvase-like endonuclease
METLVILLTIAVILLSIVIIALLTVVVVAVIKINHIARNIEDATHNLAHVTDWVVPTKVFAAVARAFRK